MKRKKKELPRKRKRFVKKVVSLICIFIIAILVAGGASYYFFIFKHQKHQIISTAQIQQFTQNDASQKEYQELQSGLQKNQIEYSSINSGDGSFVVSLKNNGKVTFSSQKDIMTQIASLQYILSHLTMEGRQFSSLDLRFDQPVVKLNS